MFGPTLVHEYLRYYAEKVPEKNVLIFGKKHYTYNELNVISDQLALGLIKLGLKRHDRVVIFLDNSAESVIALFAVLKAGGVFVIVHGAIKSAKLKYVIEDSGSKILITQYSKSSIVKEAFKDSDSIKEVIWIGNSENMPPSISYNSNPWQGILRDSIINTSDVFNINSFPRIINSDLATLIYTSGSTGEPKGVITSHLNMISAARSIIEYLENSPEDIIIDTLPLSFDYGLYQVIMAIMFGGSVVLEPSFMFPVRILQKIEQERVTGFPIVPTIVAFLLNMPSLQDYDLSSLRYLTNTGSALPVDHIRKLRELFPQVRIYSMYGLTECKRVSYLPPDDLDRKPSSVGIPMPNCEVFIVDDSGKELGPGEIGELVIRGSNVMRGYWNAPRLTAETYRDGISPGEKLLYSGDLFQCDDEGYLYFVGRKDDMIKTKGERVSPKEIENVICKLEGVLEAAVIGVPDDILGKAIMAFVKYNSKNPLSKKDILKHCTENMEIFMVPKYVEFVKELPKTPNGKIDKIFLTNQYINGDLT